MSEADVREIAAALGMPTPAIVSLQFVKDVKQTFSRMERELAALNAEREQLRALAQARGIQ